MLNTSDHAKLAGFWKEDDRDWPDDDHAELRTKEMKKARAASKGFFFGYLYGQGHSIRGHNLWTDDCLGEYTQEEYNTAKKAVERRLVELDGKKLFPLKKNEYVEYNELLVLKTIYGKRVADTFLANLTGIQELIQDCQEQSKTKGTVTAIDGRELYSRSSHSALNLLLQGSAGVVAKKWMVNYHDLAKEYGLENGKGKDFYQQAYIHDEYQVACINVPEKIELMKQALREGAFKVTTDFDTKIPIRADAGEGASWAETH